MRDSGMQILGMPDVSVPARSDPPPSHMSVSMLDFGQGLQRRQEVHFCRKGEQKDPLFRATMGHRLHPSGITILVRGHARHNSLTGKSIRKPFIFQTFGTGMEYATLFTITRPMVTPSIRTRFCSSGIRLLSGTSIPSGDPIIPIFRILDQEP